jgi:baculoviral IAP repeat-containing protein 6 (apollon)
MDRWHSGGRKFVVLDFGRSVLLSDVYIPWCVDWATVTVDFCNRTDKGKNGPSI